MNLPTLIIDVQEKRPLSPYVTIEGQRVTLPIIRKALGRGGADMTLLGLEQWFVIERKEEDLASSLYGHDEGTHGRLYHCNRFERTMGRLREVQDRGGFARVLLCCSWGDYLDRIDTHHPGVTRENAIVRAWGYSKDYVPWEWAGSRDNAERWLGWHALKVWLAATDPKLARARHRELVAWEALPPAKRAAEPCPIWTPYYPPVVFEDPEVTARRAAKAKGARCADRTAGG